MGEADQSSLIEQALLKALEYEAKVRGVYAEAIKGATDPVGRKVFAVLADEEQGHLDYLEHKLGQWRERGVLEPGGLTSALPSREAIDAGVRTLERRLQGAPGATEEQLLRKALAVEEETSAFYRRMVSELPKAGRDFFFPFMTIEDGHVAIVQAELDSVTNMGFWFDYREFDLEAG